MLLEDDEGVMREVVAGDAAWGGIVIKLENDGGPTVVCLGTGADIAASACELLVVAANRDSIPAHDALELFKSMFTQAADFRQNDPRGSLVVATDSIKEASEMHLEHRLRNLLGGGPGIHDA